ncbi:fimbrial protein [Siccibacter colletis]|uniref:fimbrial protein n=1 Tax=Siccibacter colletis TaxID=1505757 RepID=UPI0028BE9C6F|nr:fimbrial protein [Siccibacter colletis]WNN47061.1 fimbrial protein [Siccibacter colletis]
MKAKLILLTLYMAAIAYALPSLAADTTMTMTATVVASPCTVDSDSITKTIALDGGNGFQAKDLQSAGASSAWVNFDLKLIDCPAGTTNAVMTLSGTPDEANPDSLYKNTGTAENVAVELQGTGGQHFGNGKTFTGVIVNNAYTFHLQTRAYTTDGGVTPGTIQAVVTANFTYQ